LIFVDCEAVGPCPSIGTLTEFGAVEYVSTTDSRRGVEVRNYETGQSISGGPVGQTFHGRIFDAVSDPENPKVSSSASLLRPLEPAALVFVRFDRWLEDLHPKGGVSFVSDNPAFDWMWICDGLWRHVGRNRFGHSARRIGDFYAGLTNDHSNTQRWKRLRVTKHDHNPVHDAMGNVEAFDRMLKGERV
jgi:hypothetical protein